MKWLARVVSWGIFGLFLAVGSLTLVLAVLPTQDLKSRADALAPDGVAETITLSILRQYQTRAAWAAGIFLAVGLVGFWKRRRLEAALTGLGDSMIEEGGSVWRSLRAAWAAEPLWHRGTLLALMGIGIAARLVSIDQPMRHDEAFTFVNYVSRPLLVGLSHYSSPNNHLFHTLLAHLSCRLFGEAPWAVRLPVCLAGFFLVPAVYAAARALYGRAAALPAAAFVAASPALIEYATNARGYMLQAFFFTLLLGLSHALLENRARAGWALFAVLSGAGIYANPSMLYGLGMVVLLMAGLLVADRSQIGRLEGMRRLGGAMAGGAALAALGYLPPFMISHFASITSDPMLQPAPWSVFFRNLAVQSRETIAFWGQGVSAPVQILSGVGFLAAFSTHRRSLFSPTRLVLAAGGTFAGLFALNPVAPFPRLLLHALVVYLLLAAAGLSALLERLPGADRRPGLLSAAAALAVAFWMGISDPGARSFASESEFPQAPEVASFLAGRLAPEDRVVGVCPLDAPLQYAFHRAGLPEAVLALNPEKDPPSRARMLSPGARRFFILVNERRESLEDLVHKTGLHEAGIGKPSIEARFGRVAVYTASKDLVSDGR